MERRFVIQLHTTAGGRHYDLMLQAGKALATWRLETLPAELGPGQHVEAIALPDHRLAYLDYEGPISRGRGSVRIVETGSYRLEAQEEGCWRFELLGRNFDGQFILRRLAGERWSLQRLDAPPAPHEASADPR
ncbi:MAG: hypothetical protein B1H04_03060 [Planctomycetales bacterium 4484_123]|nr:MAG: hypothetical protein B1H04_03060 [Planctomycetales bacterium 4484_123]